jgi:general secretion pathway protein M
MNAETMSASGAQANLRQQAGIWWRARTPRERQAVVVVVLVLVLFLIWSVFVQPALRTIREAPAQLDRLDAQTQQIQRAANEVDGLRGATRVSPTQAAAALKAATDRLGANARLNLQGDRATLTITGAGVNATALRAWLSEARSGARARPTDAQLQRGSAGYTGTIGVVLGGSS